MSHRFLCPGENWICCWSSIHFARRSCGAIGGNNHFSGCWGNASSQTKLHEQEQQVGCCCLTDVRAQPGAEVAAVCLHGAGSWSPCRARHPQGLSLPCQPSAHGWEALQRYMDSMLCLKTSFVLPKVACPQSHRAAELFAHSSWSKIQDWLSLLLGEAKETVKVGTAEGWAVRWISLGWPVTELCMATLCLSWGISLPAFFVFLPNEIRDFKSIKGIQSTKNIPGGICGLRTNLNKCICMERIVITASCTHLCSDCKKPQLLFCNVFQKFQTKETENSVQKKPQKTIKSPTKTKNQIYILVYWHSS